MFSVWAFSWAKWPQTADSTLASSIFGTYVRNVGECMCAQGLLTVHRRIRSLGGHELHADVLQCCACQMQHVCLQQRNGQTPEVWLI